MSNFFANIEDVPIALNNLLQGKPIDAISDLSRVLVNTTLGIGGCFDIAGKMGIPKHEEDFGQTIGRWGSGPGRTSSSPSSDPAPCVTPSGASSMHTPTRSRIYRSRVIATACLSSTRSTFVRSLLPAERALEGMVSIAIRPSAMSTCSVAATSSRRQGRA